MTTIASSQTKLLLLVSSALHFAISVSSSALLGPQYTHGHRLLYDETQSNNTSGFHLAPKKPNGDASCLCLSYEELSKYARSPSLRTAEVLGEGFDPGTYGIGCEPHDVNTTMCSDVDKCTKVIPLPTDCDKSWCRRSFCFIDPNKCSLYNKPSTIFPDLHYSYATCGHMDSFTYSDRKKSLQGKTLKVALNSNTGGWMGAYHPDGSFADGSQLWTGPMVDFMKDAAARGGFTLNITRPPEWLREESERFFGDSSFDYCVYGTSLGYLDLCVAAYTITDKRASVAPFFELGSDPVYLVIFADQEAGTSMESFIKSMLTIFQPFTYGSWIMIAVFCLPVLGLLMLFHEYGKPGSAFPDEIEVIKTDTSTGEQALTTQKIPFSQHIPKALYMSYLSFFNGSYDPTVISVGGKINLLAIVSFVLLVLAVYTANLAAILTQDASKNPIDNLDEALKAGYNFCAARTVATRIIDLFGVDPSRFVPDPPSLGGDGKPGFNCPTCGARERIFDFMKQNHRNPSLYCDAALVSYEDLQVLHQYGLHCNKTEVGDILAFRDFGIPISSSISDEVMSWLHEMKYEGILDRHIRDAQPESQCPDNEGEEGIALNVQQLTGIWTIVFSFALAGILAKCLLPFMDNTKDTWATQKLQKFDQWCNPIDMPIKENVETKEMIPETESETDSNSDWVKSERLRRMSSRNTDYQSCESGSNISLSP